MIKFDEAALDIFEALNRIRASPASILPILESRVQAFDGMMLRREAKRPIQTKEGRAAYLEAIDFVRIAKPAPALKWHAELGKVAHEHAVEIGTKGMIGHCGSDGSLFEERVAKHLDWQGMLGENIDFGSAEADDVLVSMIVDDGVPSRSHRKNLFRPEFLFVGIGCNVHRDYKYCVVLDFASTVQEKHSSQQPLPHSTPLPAREDDESLLFQIVEEINQLRSHPQRYLTRIEALLNKFDGFVLNLDGEELPIDTYEGREAIYDCLDWLRTMKGSVPTLRYHSQLSQACADHAKALGAAGVSGHFAVANDLEFGDRVAKYVSWKGKMAEVCDFGSKVPQNIVSLLLIDDGNKERGNRLALLDPTYTHIGVATVPHKVYNTCTVITLACELAPLTNLTNTMQSANQIATSEISPASKRPVRLIS